MLEKLHEEGGTEQDADNIFASQQGENADKLQAAGRSLPSFRDFLQRCGLAEDASGSHQDIGSSSNDLPAIGAGHEPSE